jgi:hypothetical protein
MTRRKRSITVRGVGGQFAPVPASFRCARSDLERIVARVCYYCVTFQQDNSFARRNRPCRKPGISAGLSSDHYCLGIEGVHKVRDGYGWALRHFPDRGSHNGVAGESPCHRVNQLPPRPANCGSRAAAISYPAQAGFRGYRQGRIQAHAHPNLCTHPNEGQQSLCLLFPLSSKPAAYGSSPPGRRGTA